MSKWESTKLVDDIPLHMYKLNDLAIKQFGIGECQKGISINGVVLKDTWKTFVMHQPNLTKFVYRPNDNKDGYIDYKEYRKSDQKTLTENIRPS